MNEKWSDTEWSITITKKTKKGKNFRPSRFDDPQVEYAKACQFIDMGTDGNTPYIEGQRQLEQKKGGS